MTTPTEATAAGEVPGRPARPGGAAYWARVVAIVDQAPPLSKEQRATIRLALWGTARRAAA